MYSEGGVMATKAFDAITLTLYTGLADSWSSGGRKEDNVLAGAHKRFNLHCTDTHYKTSVMRKQKLLCCVLHTRLELSQECEDREQ